MPEPVMSAQTLSADRLTMAELVRVWNAGFAGYYVDVTMTEAKLAQHVRRAGIALAESVVLATGAERIGFSLLAVTGGPAAGGGAARSGWIGGFGVAPAQRGRGWAGRLIAAQLARAAAAGLAEVRLEVIAHNPARRVYREAGFAEEGELRSFSGVPDPAWAAQGLPLTRLPVADVAEWHGPLHGDRQPTWRRELPTLARILHEEARAEAWAVEDEEGYPACALVLPEAGRIQILDAAAVGRAAAHDLLAGLAREYPGQGFLLIDEPAESPLAAVCAEFGLREALQQVGMRWTAPGAGREPERKAANDGGPLTGP